MNTTNHMTSEDPDKHLDTTHIRYGQDSRRGLLREGDRVQICDPKGRLYTVTLVNSGRFQTTRGSINHHDIIGRPDGQVLVSDSGQKFQVLRSLRSDYVMSMPRGAAVIYPKDIGTIVNMGDIFPGARVIEAGAGSGALSMALLDAVGLGGKLISVERREDFAEIAAANVDLWFGRRHPAWDLRVSDVADALDAEPAGSIDRVVLDMLAPWEHLEGVARTLTPGGVFLCYVTTVTQMSRLAEEMRKLERFTDPIAWETMQRGWHLNGLAVRPEHRMVAHTGFLVTARILAPEVIPMRSAMRPAPAAEGLGGMWDDEAQWSDHAIGIRTSPDKRVRKVARQLKARVDTWVDANGGNGTDSVNGD